MAKVLLLRVNGKRVERQGDDMRFEGAVRSHMAGVHHVATMRTGHSIDDKTRLPPDLYHPSLEQMTPTGIRILGFENHPDGAKVQEWVIDF